MSFFQELKRRNVVRVGIAYVLMAWLLLQAADFVLDLIDAPNWVIQAFALLVAIGLPIALFLAWAFELTPEGVKRESEIDRSQSITHKTGRKLDFVIIGFLALIIVLMGIERLFFAGGENFDMAADPSLASTGNEAGNQSAPPPAVVSKSIAVLPFADLSQAQDQRWFADGLAEEILNALVKVPDLSVTARTSSFQFRDSDQSIEQIGAELGVAHVLEGSVRSSGNRIRVTAQLIRASDGFHLWSENYDRDQADMISIQEDLASSIATALETSMDPEALAQMARAGTRSVEAYQAYLRGLQLAMSSFDSANQGDELFQQAYYKMEEARTIDPEFAEAHVQAANYWKVELSPTRTDSGTSGLRPLQMLQEYNDRMAQAVKNARSEADRIRSLADRALMDLRLREARALFDQYLEIRPNDELARFELVQVLALLSDRDALREVLTYWETKGETDSYIANALVNEAYRVWDPSEAADFGLKSLQRWPGSTTLLYQTHRTLLWAGRNREASELAARFNRLVPEGDLLVSTREACASGDRETAEANRIEMEKDIERNRSWLWLVHNMLGNTKEEIEILRPLEQSGVPFMLATFLNYHKFDPRPYPGLMAILEREGVNRALPAVPPFRCPPAD
jgi:TolB-like protein